MTGTASGEDSRPASGPPGTEALLTALAEAVAAVLQPQRVAWTKAEAAFKLGCTESWLEEKARLREISFTRLSGALHFTDGHLAEIIALFEERPASEKPAAPATARQPAAKQKGAATAAPLIPVAPAGVPQLLARAPRSRGVPVLDRPGQVA